MEVIRAQLMGIISGPARNLVGVVAGGVRQVVNVLNAYAEEGQAGSGCGGISPAQDSRLIKKL